LGIKREEIGRKPEELLLWVEIRGGDSIRKGEQKIIIL